MNKIYRLIWSKAKEKWVVVAEKVKSRGSIPSFVIGSAALMAAVLSGALPGWALDPGALPTGGKITSGSGTISTSGSQMTINQTTQQIIANWNTFNIGASAGVTFVQPNNSATALNRITDQNPSQILGSLTANGQIFLLNPSGIVFGKGSTVNVGGLVASSLNMADSDFLNGKYTFSGSSTAGSVINQGSITANGGVVALLAPKVYNEGTITTTSGTTLLAAGDQVSIDFTGDGLINYTVDQGAVDALAQNSGLIKADGGVVVMTAKAADSLTSAVVNDTGVIQAQTLKNVSGRIILDSDMQSGTTTVSGTLDASAPNGGDGGFVETSAGRVSIADTAKITTYAPSGKSGTWLIDPDGFTIAASGGDITGATLSNELSYGNVTIESTSGSGSDGNVNVNDNVSWKKNTLTLVATNDININAVMTAGATDDSGNSGTFASLDLEPGSGNVNVGMTADGLGFTGRVDFFKADGVTARSGSGFLTINNNAYTVITELGSEGDETSGGSDSSGNTTLQGLASLPSGGNFTGYFALGSNIDASATSGWNSGSGFVAIGTYASPFNGAFNGLGHTISGLTINNSNDYQGLFGVVLNSSIANVGLVNASVNGNNYVGGLVGANFGFSGNSSVRNSFVTGSVSGAEKVGGLVGYNYGYGGVAAIDNSASSADVSGQLYVGGLVGWNRGGGYSSYGSSTGAAYITNSHATGSVTGYGTVGGLVGENLADNRGSGYPQSVASISNSFATGAVTGSGSYNTGDGIGVNIGGLVGKNYGWGGNASITNSYATGKVDASTSENVGGLVGLNSAVGTAAAQSYGFAPTALIDNSYATGKVSGGNNAGGLVGLNSANTNGYGTGVYGSGYGYGYGRTVAKISNSYATGAVDGGNFTGGLVGLNQANATDSTTAEAVVSSSFATGAVSGFSHVGGLVGGNLAYGYGGSYARAAINNSYATGAVTGTWDDVGGLVGWNSAYSDGSAYGSRADISNSYALGSVTGSRYAGGLVGWNIADGQYAYGTINSSFATGNVVADGDRSIGGLVGSHESNNMGSALISNSFATGNVTSTGSSTAVGGLVGYSYSYDGDSTASISDSFATGNVTNSGGSGTGSLIGYNGGYAVASYVFATGKVDGSSSGPLVGTSSGSSTVSNIINPKDETTFPNGGISTVTYLGGDPSLASSWDGGVLPTLFDKVDLNGQTVTGNIIAWDLANTDNSTINFGTSAVNTVTIAKAGTGSDSVDLGTVTINYSSDGNLGLTSGKLNLPNAPYLTMNGTTYTVITQLGAEGSTTGTDLQGIDGNLSGNYVLGLDIDASAAAIWDGGYGFSSIGSTGPFAGALDGLGHAVSNLTISNSWDEQGLFGTTNGATLRNIGLVNLNLSTSSTVGGLVGSAYNTTIDSAYASGTIVSSGDTVGGLVGLNHNGSIANSNANVDVTGDYNVGGLVGFNYAYGGNSSIANSSASGKVVGNHRVGGLVGLNHGGNGGLASITSSKATGSVTGNYEVGGLVGKNEADGTGSSTSINSSYATGKVTGYGDDTGGLVGYNYAGSGASASIINSHATGEVDAFDQGYAGGLVGESYTSGGTVVIDGSYATGNVYADNRVGGLIGRNAGDDSGTVTISNSFATGNVVGTGDYVGGLVGENGGNSGTTIIDNSYATGNVTGSNYVGGLVGMNYANNGSATITGSHATGAVTGSSRVGGLVGSNYGSGNPYGESDAIISSSFATGAVAGSFDIGGLVGINFATTYGGNALATISNSYATGAVTGGDYAGGLVGFSGIWGDGTVGAATASITNSHATGAVTGNYYVGGLVGGNANLGANVNTAWIASIDNSYATGTVTGSGDNVGGLVGYNYTSGGGKASVSSVYATGDVTGQNNVGGLVGYNYGGSISYSYVSNTVIGSSNVGALVGYNAGAVSTSLYDNTKNGTMTGIGYDGTNTNVADVSGVVQGVTTQQLQLQSTFANDGWTIVEDDTLDVGMPVLTASGWRIHSASTPLYLELISGSSIYGDTPTLTYGLFTADGTQVLDANATGTVTWSTALTSTSNVGTYSESYVSGITLGNASYTLAGAGTSTSWVITPRPLTVSVSKTYSSTNSFDSGFVLSGMVNGDAAPGITGSATVSSANVGNYSSFTNSTLGLDNGNYTLTGGTVAASITPASLTITGKTTSSTYTAGVQTNSTGFTTSGLLGSDTVTGVSGQGSGTNVGTYTDSLNSAEGSGLSNYNITYVNGSLAITPAALTITGKTTSSTYTAGVQTNSTGFTTSGLLGNDKVASVSGQGSGTNVGTYADSLNSAEGIGLSNYNITYVNGSLAITPASLTITGKTTSSTYTAGVQTNSTDFTTSGLLGNDKVASVSGQGSGTNAGTYTDNLNSAVGSGLSNYTITYTNGSIAITPAALTITANDGSKTYGQNITFSGTEYTSSGLVNGETIGSVTLTSAGAPVLASVAGSPYAIVVSDATGGTFNPANYDITYHSGTLTVNPGLGTPTQTVQPTPPVVTAQSTTPAQPVPSASVVNTGNGTTSDSAVTVPAVLQGSGIITVTVPDGVAKTGSSFTFPLPDQVKNAASTSAMTEKVALPDGGPLPAWLQYNPESKKFTAIDVPSGGLPIKVVVTVGSQSWTVDITEKSE